MIDDYLLTSRDRNEQYKRLMIVMAQACGRCSRCGYVFIASTTPFMLLALCAFSKSSQRLHDWLYSHPLFGPPLQQWRSHRVIPGKAKLLAVATMVASFIYLAFFTVISVWITALIALVMLYVAAFILSKPSRVPE